MNKEKTIIFAIAFSVLSVTGCGLKNEERRVEKESEETVEMYTISQENTYFKTIKIEKRNVEIIVSVQYTDKENRYIGTETDDQILVLLENGDTLHMYKNGETELRVFCVVQDGFQPEDIEWTFFKQ